MTPYLREYYAGFYDLYLLLYMLPHLFPAHLSSPWGLRSGEGYKLLYISYIDTGMCSTKGYGFQAVFFGNWIWSFTFFAFKWVCLFHGLKQDVEFNQKLSSKRPQKSQLGAKNIFFWSEIEHEF